MSAPHPIGFGGACRRQVEVLWLSRRPLLLVTGLVAGVLLAGALPTPLARLFAAWPVYMVFAGPAWALAVWYKEEPSHRQYMWSQPVGRAEQALARVAAGLAWLWIAQAVILAAGLVIALVDGNASQFHLVTTAGWVSYFTAPLLGYLAVSCLTVPSEYPLRWLFGILLGPPLALSVLDMWLGLVDRMDVLFAMLGRWSLTGAMLGPWTRDVRQLALVSPDGAFARVRFIFESSTWWLTMPLWVVGLGFVLVFLASRHPDTLPRLGLRR